MLHGHKSRVRRVNLYPDGVGAIGGIHAHLIDADREQSARVRNDVAVDADEKRLRGRGVSDDKGPGLLVVAMLQAAIAQRGGLPLNVKFLIEGEEEIGSPQLPEYVRAHARELACDLVISADGAQWRSRLRIAGNQA